MAKPLVSEKLWAVIEPLLPPEPPKPRGGRPRIPDRAVLAGIFWVLKSGIPWKILPQQFGCCSGMTCWRRLRDWNETGVWQRLHEVLLDRLGDGGQLDRSRATVEAQRIPAAKRRRIPGRIRTPDASERTVAKWAQNAILW